MALIEFRWVPDPDGVDVTCTECGSRAKPMKIEPDRSSSYLRAINICTREGCKWVTPRLGGVRAT